MAAAAAAVSKAPAANVAAAAAAMAAMQLAVSRSDAVSGMHSVPYHSEAGTDKGDVATVYYL